MEAWEACAQLLVQMASLALVAEPAALLQPALLARWFHCPSCPSVEQPSPSWNEKEVVPAQLPSESLAVRIAVVPLVKTSELDADVLQTLQVVFAALP